MAFDENYEDDFDDDYEDLSRERSRDSGRSRRRRHRSQGTNILLIILVVAGGLGLLMMIVLAALILPAVQMARQAARQAVQQAQTRNHLQQIGLAMHNYHDVHTMFPPDGIYDADDKPYHGWQVMLLPYLDESTVYSQLDFNVPWDDPVNRHVYATEIEVMYSQDNPDRQFVGGYAIGHFSANSGLYQISQGQNGPMHTHVARMRDIVDGSSNTLMAGEVSAGYRPWGEPGNTRDPNSGLQGGPNQFGRKDGTGATFLMSDGSVRFISSAVTPEVLKAISTRDGGEAISMAEF